MVFKSFLSKAKDIDILAGLPDGVLLIDNDGNIQWSNDVATELLEIQKNELLKSEINNVIEGGLDLSKQAALSGKSVVGRAKLASERELFIEITGKTIEDCTIISLRDVTQNYKTVTSILTEHESSRKINKDKNAFLVKLSNELKSPIHSVIGFSQAMVDGLGGEMSEKQEKYIKIINKNSNELLYFMDKMIELAKTESNLFEFDFQIFDGLNTIQSVVKTFEQQIKEKSLSVAFDTDEVVKRTIFSDEGSLKVILQNIIETAIKSTDIGSIKIKASHPELEFVTAQGIHPSANATDKSYLMITVADTGAGIGEGDLDVIFEPYNQLDRPNKKNIVRSIALASVKNLVKYLKGNIWVESEPMQGTKFNIILPIEKG